MEQRFFPLLLVVLLAFFVPVLLARFRRIPVVVGEILAGIIVGPSVLGLVHGDEHTLELLAEIGFAFLMFLSGLEIDFSVLFAASTSKKKTDKQPGTLGLAGLSFGITLLTALAIGFGLFSVGLARDPWMMTLILSTTSLGIVVPILRERGLSSSRFGQTILLASLMADFVTMFLITAYVALRSTGVTLDIFLIVLIFVPVILLYQLGLRWLRIPAVRRLIRELSDATAQIKVRGAFALMIAFVVMAELIGAELILGAFLAGALASLLSRSDDDKLRYKLDAIGFGFFIPLFFIYVGVQFDLKAFLSERSSWVLLPILLVSSFGLKILSAFVFRTILSWKETIASGFLLSARLSLIIAASAIGVELGAISESTNAAIILVAALTATIAPLIFNTIMDSVPDGENNLMVIYGSGTLAFQVASELRAHGEKICFVEDNQAAATRIKKQGFNLELAEEDISSCFNEVSPKEVEAFIAVGDDEEKNFKACQMARERGIEHLLVFVTNPLYLPDYHSIGVQTLTPSVHRSVLLSLMARNRSLFDLLTSTTDNRDLREMNLMNRELDGQRLSEINFPSNVRILAIRRKDEMVIPMGTTRLSLGDRLTIVGDLDVLQGIENWVSMTGVTF